MTSPSRLSRESTTRSSVPAQNGHFIPRRSPPQKLSRFSSRLSCPVSSRPSTCARLRLESEAAASAPLGRESEQRQPNQSNEDERREPGENRDSRSGFAGHPEGRLQCLGGRRLIRTEPSGRGNGKPEHGCRGDDKGRRERQVQMERLQHAEDLQVDDEPHHEGAQDNSKEQRRTL